MHVSQADIDQFEEEGYLVVPGVVPLELCERVIEAILQFTGVDLENPDTWYSKRRAGHGIVPLHHAQPFWDVRQLPALHEVFTALYGTPRLWVTMDRASYKPPASPETRGWSREPIHWDCNPWRFKGPSIQGLVYLTDTEKDQGAFSCVPSIYKNLASYCRNHEEGSSAHHPDVDDSDLVAVEGQAGSLVVFNRLMPHTSRLNESAAHRFVQYVTMKLVTDDEARQQQVREWRGKLPPQWAINQQLPDQQIPEPGEPASLTALGRRLVGVDSWSS